MAPRKTRPSLVERTPVAEWVAAALGLVLTLAVVGYTLWEGLTQDDGPPRLSVSAGRATPTPDGYVVPIVVKNVSHATAAEVQVHAALSLPGRAPEEHTAQFAYVPGHGEVKGGIVFRSNPTNAYVALTVEGYADP